MPSFLNWGIITASKDFLLKITGLEKLWATPQSYKK